MRLSAQEEYGLRCLLQVARAWPARSLTIPEVSRLEGLSAPHAAKLLQVLRQGGLLKSVRGQTGGYSLAQPPDQITLGAVVSLLGGRFYEEKFCRSHTGQDPSCAHWTECSIRALWRSVQDAVDDVLSRTTLKDLLREEHAMSGWLHDLLPLAPMSRTAAPFPRPSKRGALSS